MNLDERILELKTEGKSLRGIASALGLSHEAVRKRLKRLSGVSTQSENGELTLSTSKNGRVSTSAKPHRSTVSEESEGNGNRVVTKKTPSRETNESVNPLPGTVEGPLQHLKGGSECVCEGNSDVDDLFSFVRATLERKGIELYRMDCEQECYQVEHEGQILRFYVKRDVDRK